LNITIVAATGGVGRQILKQAEAAGHHVTAVVRNLAKLPWSRNGLRAVTVNLAEPDAAELESAIRGADAVLSGLGAVSAAEAGVAETGTRAIIQAMHATGVRRLVVVSAAPIGTVPSPARPNPPKHDPGDGFFMRYLGAPFARRAFARQYADLARMEDLLQGSDLDWTIMRPPGLINRRLRGSYRVAIGRNVRGGVFISRSDVAHGMLDALERPETIGQTIGIAY
jgi:putative NADH-flavin reductase